MSEQHTPEPWKVVNRGDEYADDIDAFKGEGWNADVTLAMNIGKANARRIVAAVNACAGFSIEELEGASLFNDSISAQDEIYSLKSEVEDMKLIIASDTGTESAVANLQQQVSHMIDMVACEKSDAEYFKRQRDDLLGALEKASLALEAARWHIMGGEAHCDCTRSIDEIDTALASVKESA